MFKLIAKMLNFWQLCCQCLSVLHNYFNGSTKLFSDLAKFLDTLAKLFRKIISYMHLTKFLFQQNHSFQVRKL